MPKDPDIKSSKRKSTAKTSKSQNSSAKTSTTKPATKGKKPTGKSVLSQKTVSFKEKLTKLGVDPKKNKKTIRNVGIGALVALFITISVFGVLIYKYKNSNRAVKIASKIIPYPVASVNGNVVWNTAQ
ncbi:hypothetical protein H0W80_04855, partial [Candidatus Saccharibacteria bacterium]|nr:hypothetical protein [Candidatus Saccharibacteria bacterium]